MTKRSFFLRKPSLLGLSSVLLFGGCSVMPRTGSPTGSRAFIKYWAPPEGSTALRLAVKDNIDMEGVVTTAGSASFAWTHKPAKQDAPCLAIARQRGVVFVGKTNLSEFAVSPSGLNEYFGTPVSPLGGWWRKLIPGGSSCGSAVAVALGMADVAFGTDTAGSVRVPAACCGVVGLKTTFGLIPIDGIHPISPEYLDTVGPLARDVAHTVLGMDLLQDGFAARYEALTAAKPTGANIRIGRLTLKGTNSRVDKAIDEVLEKAGFQVVQLDEEFRKKFEQAKKDGNSVAAAGAWLSDGKYRLSLGVSIRTQSAILVGQLAYQTSYRKALSRKDDWQAALQNVFQNVDIIALPTLQSTPPIIQPDIKIGILEAQMLDFQNTVAFNYSGNPALAVPIPLHGSSVSLTSLQLAGPKNSEAELLNAGRIVELAIKD